jgi:hypothetical protein
MASIGPRPLYTADEAIARALVAVGHGVYQLGAGDMNSTGEGPRDCFGFAFCECYGVPRHRPGFNRGPWATVEDDLNCNSAIEDADHAGDLFERVATPAPGCLILYPTIHLPGHAGPWIGHVKIVVGISRCLEWDVEHPDWTLLDTVECCGPPGRHPGIIRGTGAGMTDHDARWPKPAHRTAMLRVKA